jgi:GWxTD domain-containing protein
MMHRSTFLILHVLACRLLAPSFAATGDAQIDVPDAAWRQGPVRYILVVQEDHGYKSLATDEERGAFIERFWAALDPTPGTESNERRTEFWKRVEEADRLFREAMTPGWKTDRGKVYILMGPPDRRETKGPAETWKYQVPPHPDAAPDVTFRFGRNGEGEYHMGHQEYVGRGALRFWDPTAETDGPAAGETFLAVRSENGTPQIMKGRFRMTEFPVASVRSDFATASLDCRLRYDFYRVKRGSTRVVVTLALPKDQFRGGDGGVQTPEVTLSVAIDDPKKNKPVGSFSETLRPAGAASASMDRPFLLQGSFTIEPGTYTAMVTILDTKSHRGIRRTEAIDAPDFGRGLALSSIAVGRLRDDAGGSGGPALIPEPDNAFHPGETIGFTFEVYNAEHKGGATTDLDLTYEFLLETEGGPRQAGRPVTLKHKTSESLAYSLPLLGWPEGMYQVRVRVTDNRTAAKAEGQGAFRVVR